MTGTVRKVATPKKSVNPSDESGASRIAKKESLPTLTTDDEAKELEEFLAEGKTESTSGARIVAGRQNDSSDKPTPTAKWSKLAPSATATERKHAHRKAEATRKAPKKPLLPPGAQTVTKANSDAWRIWDYNPAWTSEQAQAANEQIPEEFQYHPGAPLYRWAAHINVTQWEKDYAENADGWPLIRAMQECAQTRIPMPAWVCKAWLEASRAMVQGLALSWDDVLPKPYGKGLHTETIQERRNLAPLVWRAVTRELGHDVQKMSVGGRPVFQTRKADGSQPITKPEFDRATKGMHFDPEDTEYAENLFQQMVEEDEVPAERPFTKTEVYEMVAQGMGLAPAKIEELYQYENRKRIAMLVSGVLSGIKREMTEKYGHFKAGSEPSTRYPEIRQAQIERIAKLYRTHNAFVTQIWDDAESQI
jgi:hypothetical protein